MAEQDLDALLDSALEDFDDEAQVSWCAIVGIRYEEAPLLSTQVALEDIARIAGRDCHHEIPRRVGCLLCRLG